MPDIHPTAIVERGAQLADDVVVGPFCHVGPHVTVGAGTRLVSHVVVMNRTTLGCNNTVWPQATLGADPQDLKFAGEPATLEIGDNNEIRENVTIHIGTAHGGGRTSVGSDNLLMVGCHVAHDCTIGNYVVLSNIVQLAGHIRIEDHAVMAGCAAAHHYVTIGQYAFVGGMTRVIHDVPPFMVLEGNPSRVRKVNEVLLRRNRFPAESIDHLRTAYRKLYRGNGENGATTGTKLAAVEQLESEFSGDECIQSLTAFIRRTHIGLRGRYQESQRDQQTAESPTR